MKLSVNKEVTLPVYVIFDYIQDCDRTHAALNVTLPHYYVISMGYITFPTSLPKNVANTRISETDFCLRCLCQAIIFALSTYPELYTENILESNRWQFLGQLVMRCLYGCCYSATD